MAHKKLSYTNRPQLPLDSTSEEIAQALTTLNTSGGEGVLESNAGAGASGTAQFDDDFESVYQPNNPHLLNDMDLNLNLTYSSPSITPPPSSEPSSSTAPNIPPSSENSSSTVSNLKIIQLRYQDNIMI